MYRLSVTSHFSAAHNLRGFKGRCEALHGHNWKVELTVKGHELDETGLVMDFGELKRLLGQVLETLDHTYLNKLAHFQQINPSSELIARYIHDRLAPMLPAGVKIEEVAVWESPGSRAAYIPS